MADWKETFAKELQMAVEARARGNEGQARVCARRAAGAAIREYFWRQGIPGHTTSAYDLLRALLDIPDVPAEAHRAAEYLTLRVNDEFKLPADIDLLAETRALGKSLLPGEFAG